MQLNVDDIHNEYGQQIATLSQRCAMLAAANAALVRDNKRLTEAAQAKAELPPAAPTPQLKPEKEQK